MRCLICRKGPNDNVPIYRVNPKGQKGIWACKRHISQTDAPPIDSDVAIIVDAIARNHLLKELK